MVILAKSEAKLEALLKIGGVTESATKSEALLKVPRW